MTKPINMNHLTILTQFRNLVLSAHTVQNTLKEMRPVWEEYLDENGHSVVTKDLMSRPKYMIVQMYARRLMKHFTEISGLSIFPMAMEDVRVGNWRVDSILLQIASNEVKGHEHLYQLLMTNLFGVPTSLFDTVKGGYKVKDFVAILKAQYPLEIVGLELDETDEVATEEYTEKLFAKLF